MLGMGVFHRWALFHVMTVYNSFLEGWPYHSCHAEEAYCQLKVSMDHIRNMAVSRWYQTYSNSWLVLHSNHIRKIVPTWTQARCHLVFVVIPSHGACRSLICMHCMSRSVLVKYWSTPWHSSTSIILGTPNWMAHTYIPYQQDQNRGSPHFIHE